MSYAVTGGPNDDSNKKLYLGLKASFSFLCLFHGSMVPFCVHSVFRYLNLHVFLCCT